MCVCVSVCMCAYVIAYTHRNKLKYVYVYIEQSLNNIARAILKKYCPPHKARGIHDFILATKSSVWMIII